MRTNWLFFLIFTVVLSQATFGELFYKVSVGGLFLSELVIVLAWLGVFLSVVKKKTLPLLPFMPLLGLFFLGVLYFILSFTSDRLMYWVLRQGAFLIYLSVSVLAYIYASRRPHSPLNLKRLSVVLGVLGATLLIFHRVIPIVPGRAPFTAFLCFLVGCSGWINSQKTYLRMCVVCGLCTLFMALVSTHTAWGLAIPILFFSTIYLRNVKYRAALLIVSFCVALLAGVHIEGLFDYNATWRFLYWQGVVEESWGKSFFLVGKGFGCVLFPEDSQYFWRLITQVAQGKIEYQLHTVPPHNSVLTILIFLGAPGVILFLYPYVKFFRNRLGDRCGTELELLFVIQCGMLIPLLSNQFLEVPYCAVIFWWFYGLFVFYVDKTSVNAQVYGK